MVRNLAAHSISIRKYLNSRLTRMTLVAASQQPGSWRKESINIYGQSVRLICYLEHTQLATLVGLLCLDVLCEEPIGDLRTQNSAMGLVFLSFTRAVSRRSS